MKTPEAYYEKLRKAGETEDITSNPNPDYTLLFYQNIFRLMEQYHKEASQEEAKERLDAAIEYIMAVNVTGGLFELLPLEEGLRMASGLDNLTTPKESKLQEASGGDNLSEIADMIDDFRCGRSKYPTCYKLAVAIKALPPKEKQDKWIVSDNSIGYQTIIFPKNEINFMQDMGFHRNVPHGIKFVIADITKQRRLRLIAEGYGALRDNRYGLIPTYGNGAISVSILNLPKHIQDLIPSPPKEQMELNIGDKIKIGPKYAEKWGWKKGEVIELIPGLYCQTQTAPSVWDDELKDSFSIFHLFGNDLEDFMDCELLKEKED